MDQEITTVTSKGQLVIPARFRKALKIKKGTRISVIERDGQLVLQPITDDYFERLFGMFAGGSSMSESLIREHEEEDID